MQAKTLLIPIAAFALSATGVSAFNSDVLQKAGLTQEQISAFETAAELRKSGDKDAARDVIAEAGIDLETMESVREAMHEHKDAMRTAIEEAVKSDDFDAFLAAIEGSPLADIVTTEADFELFRDAHNLHLEGKHSEAHEIMQELGFETPGIGLGHKMHHMMTRN